MHALILAPFTDDCLERLRVVAEVDYESWLHTRRLYDPEELGARLAASGTSVLVVEADFVFDEVFAAAPTLRLVGVCRNALNQVDIDSATEHGVMVTHAVGRNTNAVAEMTVGLMLALVRHIPQASRLVAGAGWRDPTFGYREFRGREIAGSTVGLVGFGQIGREVARKCVALGARVLVCDPLVPERDVRAFACEPMGLLDLAATSDVVSLHAPDLDATRHMIDARFFKAMRSAAYLVNTGGGGTVDPEALADALESGGIAGAALDVFEGQPLPASSRLMSAPNIILTPHIGGATEETIARHSQMITEEIERFARGEPLLHAVNDVKGVARAG